jgi:hypothetical protein
MHCGRSFKPSRWLQQRSTCFDFVADVLDLLCKFHPSLELLFFSRIKRRTSHALKCTHNQTVNFVLGQISKVAITRTHFRLLRGGAYVVTIRETLFPGLIFAPPFSTGLQIQGASSSSVKVTSVLQKPEDEKDKIMRRVLATTIVDWSTFPRGATFSLLFGCWSGVGVLW